MMQTTQDLMKNSNIGLMFKVLSEQEKKCPKHGINYTEKVFKNHTLGCPKCSEEENQKRSQDAINALESEKRAIAEQKAQEQLAQRIGQSGVPPRFINKTIAGYKAQTSTQKHVVERVKAYCIELSQNTHNGRNLAFLGNVGTGKTHLACAIANHVIKNCGKQARFVSVSELNRIVRESKRFDNPVTESQVIEDFGRYDLLVLDEVGIQSGTDAESRALFDVFNHRYQQLKPTIFISNLGENGFFEALGERIVDRLMDDGGEVLIFDWESARS